MRISPYLEKCIEVRVEKEIEQALSQHHEDMVSQIDPKTASRSELDAWKKREQEEREAMQADAPNYRKLRTQQLRDWVKSLPPMPPDEMFPG